MPRLIHLAPESAERSIRRSGVRGASATVLGAEGPITVARAVYAMPVLPSVWDTHQWARELRRGNGERRVAVHLRLPADEPVWVGRYNLPHERLPLAEAIARVRSAPAGNEVVLERSVPASAVLDVRAVPRLVGWTESPEPSAFDCVCDACLPTGTPNLKARLRAERRRWFEAARAATSDEALIAALRATSTPSERLRSEPVPAFVRSLSSHPSADVRTAVARTFAYGPPGEPEASLVTLLSDDDASVRSSALDAVVRRVGPLRSLAYLASCDESMRREFVRDLPYRVSRDDGVVERLLRTIEASDDDAMRDEAGLLRDELDADA